MKNILKSFLPANPKYFFIAFWFIFGLIISTIPLVRGSNGGMIYLGPSLLWSLAFLISGTIVGFIFGIPTVVSQNTQSQAGGGLTLANQREVVMANTNLTQVSDWVTKIIIGAGLVQLGKIPGLVNRVASKIGTGIKTESGFLDYATGVSGGIFIFYTCYGFVFGYLIMRIILTELFVAKDPGELTKKEGL